MWVPLGLWLSHLLLGSLIPACWPCSQHSQNQDTDLCDLKWDTISQMDWHMQIVIVTSDRSSEQPVSKQGTCNHVGTNEYLASLMVVWHPYCGMAISLEEALVTVNALSLSSSRMTAAVVASLPFPSFCNSEQPSHCYPSHDREIEGWCHSSAMRSHLHLPAFFVFQRKLLVRFKEHWSNVLCNLQT